MADKKANKITFAVSGFFQLKEDDDEVDPALSKLA